MGSNSPRPVFLCRGFDQVEFPQRSSMIPQSMNFSGRVVAITAATDGPAGKPNGSALREGRRHRVSRKKAGGDQPVRCKERDLLTRRRLRFSTWNMPPWMRSSLRRTSSKAKRLKHGRLVGEPGKDVQTGKFSSQMPPARISTRGRGVMDRASFLPFWGSLRQIPLTPGGLTLGENKS